MAAADLQVRQHLGNRLGSHRRAVIGMNRAGVNAAVSSDSVLDKCLGQVAVLGGVNFPSDCFAGENVQYHVQVEVDSPPWSFQLGYVPGPDLGRAGGDQFRADPGGVGGLSAAL